MPETTSDWGEQSPDELTRADSASWWDDGKKPLLTQKPSDGLEPQTPSLP